MSFIERLRRMPRQPQIKAMAEQIVARSRHAVWQRVRGRVPSMGTNEARGYIRARAAVVMAREIEIELSHHQPVRTSVRSRVEEVAAELMVHVVLSHAHVERRPVFVPRRQAA